VTPSPFIPPWYLNNGLLMTVFIAKVADRFWQRVAPVPEPPYQSHRFYGEGGVPIHGLVAIPPQAKGTFVGTYGITGNLDNQWYLRVFGRKAYAQGYGVVLFDWRAHGKTADLSPTLTADGLHEGPDFVQIAAQAKVSRLSGPLLVHGLFPRRTTGPVGSSHRPRSHGVDSIPRH
jgi:predicted alpha/beta-fold hydrolase